jgi:hypothetical protein
MGEGGNNYKINVQGISDTRMEGQAALELKALSELTQCFGNVNACHCGRAFKQDVSALTLLPGICKDCPNGEWDLAKTTGTTYVDPATGGSWSNSL